MLQTRPGLGSKRQRSREREGVCQCFTYPSKGLECLFFLKNPPKCPVVRDALSVHSLDGVKDAVAMLVCFLVTRFSRLDAKRNTPCPPTSQFYDLSPTPHISWLRCLHTAPQRVCCVVRPSTPTAESKSAAAQFFPYVNRNKFRRTSDFCNCSTRRSHGAVCHPVLGGDRA